MTHYANLSGDSGVAGYSVGDDSITVYFHGGTAYLYTFASASAGTVNQMKSLAASGRGLSKFIAQTVKARYALRFDRSEQSKSDDCR